MNNKIVNRHITSFSAKKLYELRPDMFDDDRIKSRHKPSQYTLAITDAHVLKFFDAVKKSMPRGRFLDPMRSRG